MNHSKNIVYGSITAGGNVHIGDIYFTVDKPVKQSILFLRIENTEGAIYTLNLSVKSMQETPAKIGTTSKNLLHEAVKVNIPAQLFADLNDFQTFRRSIDTQTRYSGIGRPDNQIVQTIENKLAQQILSTFFAGDIGQVCADFIQLLEDQRIKELLLAISADDEVIINLPFEMVLPLLFPPKSGEAKKSLAISNFGLVRTKMTSLETFKLQGEHATAAPLKMLFITALPENLDERGKMLQIEEEQTRLIQSIGALEATGDHKPKIVIEFLENASLAELDKALRARQHDIVHISGHGAYHAAENKGVLYFENEDGDEAQISGAALGETLRQHACVKLLILSACETAMAGKEGGVTEQAANYVPSIVAMRFAVTDEGAKVFTTEFYTQLAKGLSLTRALAYAREALHQDIVQRREQTPQVLHIAEWFTPVVYQNQSVGALIDKTQPYQLPDHFYPQSSFLKTSKSRLIGEGFIGRKRYLIQLRQAFRAGRHVCLHGLGGLGKTTLAEAFAHNYDNHSHTTLIFRNCHQINEVHILNALNKEFAKINRDLADQIQQAIEDPQTDILDKLQLLITNYLKGRKTILIFDNVEDVQTSVGDSPDSASKAGDLQRSIGSAPLSAFLRHLCENTPHNCHILFTTRYKIEDLADVLEHLALDKMGYAEQYRLLNYSETLRGIPLQDRDDVYKRLDGHPRGYEYLETLLKKDRTFTWQQVAHSEAKVFENLLLAKVYERLTESEKAIFQIVAVFITRTPLSALAAVSGKNEADLWPVLQSLQDWSLCFLEKDRRFEVHRLTREWMRQNIMPLEVVKEYALKAGGYFEAQLTLDEVVLAKDYFEIAEAWEPFAISSFELQNHYQLKGLYRQAFELNRVVLEKNVAEKPNSIALFNMGAIFIVFGQNNQALEFYEQSLAINKKIGDRQSEGATLNGIGQILAAKGEYDSALGCFKQSLTISQQNGNRQNEAVSMSNISHIYKIKGDSDTALHYLEQCLKIQQQIDDLKGVGTTLNNLAAIAYSKGDYETALGYFEQSLDIQQQIGNRRVEGITMNNISQIYHIKGYYDKALGYLRQSLAIRQQIGDRNGEGTTLHNISRIHNEIGDHDKAFYYLEQALTIRQQIGDRQGEAVTLNNLAINARALGDHDLVLRYLEQSLAIQQQIGDIPEMATTMTNIGAHLFEQERYEDAIPLLKQAYSIFQKIDSPTVQVAERFLEAIIERIGESRFQEIVSKMNES